MSANTVCFHFKFGYCKHGDHCRKRHVKDKCEKQECDPRTCDQRHPQYEHVFRTDPVLEELKLVKEKVEVIENKIEEKVVSTSLSHSFTPEPSNMSTLIKLGSRPLDTYKGQASLDTIPQLDWCTNVAATNLQPQHQPEFDQTDSKECDNCHSIFDTLNQLEDHYEDH